MNHLSDVPALAAFFCPAALSCSSANGFERLRAACLSAGDSGDYPHDERGHPEHAARCTLHAQPFKPFLLRLTDGTLVPVPHPDFMVVSQGGRTAIITTEGEKFSIVDIGLVTTIELGSQPSS